MTPSSTTPVSISLRRATAQDSDFAYQVKRTTLGHYVRQVWGWDEDEQRRLHKRRFASQDFRIVVVSGIDAGVLALEYMPDCLRVNQLLPLPEYQGRGIGTACTRQVLDDAAGRGLPVRLQVLKANGRAAGFYRRLGFQTMGEDDIHIRIEKLA